MVRRLRFTVSALLIACGPLQACSGGDDDSASPTPADVADGDDGATFVVADEPAGDNCPAGGVAITRGVDADGDGMLSADEVEDSHFACNAPSAAPGASMPVVIATEVLAAGDAHCPTGGVAVHHGADGDGDGTLDSNERAGTDFVCNGANLDGLVVCLPPARRDAAGGGCVNSVDWSGSELASADLGSTYLAGVDLSEADLTGANLVWSDLRGASFAGADLTGADLSHALVDGADFTGAVLDGADLTGVDFRDATLADATGSHLLACPERLPEQWVCVELGELGKTLLGPGAGLSGLDLSSVDLSDADLGGTQTTMLVACPAELPPGFACLDLPQTGKTLVGPGADLSGLNLSNANFSPVTNLRDVSFEQSVLAGATFAAGTNLSDARFSGADLTGVNLSTSNLEGAVGINLVACPAGLPADFSCRALPHTGNTLLGPDTDLSGLDLSGADLSGVVLSNADLAETNLDNANLSGADLQDAKLEQADLAGAVLNGANLDGADLGGANLTGVQAANLDNCPDSLPSQWTCKDDTLLGPGADLSGLNLSGLDFSGGSTHLEGADLSSANLSNAILSDADLNGADLSSANLTNAVLESVNLSNATLDNANLTDANLNDATVAGASFAGATFSDTTCPNGNSSDTQGNTCP